MLQPATVAASENAENIVFSRPIWSDTQPKNGREKTFMKRSSITVIGRHREEEINAAQRVVVAELNDRF